jgi:hypothetical protein
MMEIAEIPHSEIKSYLRQNKVIPSVNFNIKDVKSVVDYMLKNSNYFRLFNRCS